MAGGRSFELTPNAQIWPRKLNAVLPGGKANDIYLVVRDLGQNSGQGLDFILGVPFLERFYSVYDTRHRRVGLATTQFTNAVIN
jgi:cathepsin E